MTHIPANVRLRHGLKVEADFLEYINIKPCWRSRQLGQILCNDDIRNDLRKAKIPTKSKLGNELISLLPDYWQHIYKRGVGKYMPSLCRWDADAFCVYNGEPKFFTEIKSSMTRTNNITIEMSCYLAAIANRQRLGLPLYFIFSPFDENPYWTYLTIDQIADATVRVLDGRGCSGSATPFALVSKDYLTQKVDDLLETFADEWLL